MENMVTRWAVLRIRKSSSAYMENKWRLKHHLGEECKPEKDQEATRKECRGIFK